MRTRFISYWNYLEFLRQQEDFVSLSEISENLDVTPGEAYIVLKRLIVKELVIRKLGKPIQYKLAKNALEFLQKNTLYSFTDEGNIYLKKAKRRAWRRNKYF